MTTPRQRAVEEFCRECGYTPGGEAYLKLLYFDNITFMTKAWTPEGVANPKKIKEFLGILDANNVWHPFEYVEEEHYLDKIFEACCIHWDNPRPHFSITALIKEMVDRIKSLEARLEEVEK